MLNLIKMDLYRLFKTKSYKFGLVVSFIMSFGGVAFIAGMGKLIPFVANIVKGDSSDTIDFPFFSEWFSGLSIFEIILKSTTFLSLMIVCMIAANFISDEQAGGYIKNIAGQAKSKSMLVVSKFFTVAVISLTVIAVYIIGSFAAGFMFFNNTINFRGFGDFAVVLAVRYVLYLAINSIVLFLCTLTKSKTLAVAFGIIFGTGLSGFAYGIVELFISFVFSVELAISTYTPDGLVFSIGTDSSAGSLIKAVIVGIVFIVAFLFLSSFAIKKRDTK